MLGADLPRVVVTSLGYHPVTRTLVAGSYGRSVFAYELASPPTAVGEAPDPDDRFAAGRLLAPYPNPASNRTTIAFAARRQLDLTVTVYSVAGRKIWQRKLDAAAGQTASLRWDGRDDRGRKAASGVYLVQVSANERILGSQSVVLRK